MKTEKRFGGIGHMICADEEGRKCTGVALIGVIFFSILFINLVMSQPSTSQPVGSGLQPRAAIVDQLSLTFPNQTFIETATNTLEQAGYTVDYYQAEQVTVDFYRNLPTHGYGIIILRAHATKEGVLFTSESYSNHSYVWEQLLGQIQEVSYSTGECFFGVAPSFVESCLNGTFTGTVVIATGCDTLESSNDLAKAFINKGVKVYFGWSGSVLASHTDEATLSLLNHLLLKKETVGQADENVMLEVGLDPEYNSQLEYCPSKAEEQTIEIMNG